MKKIAICGHGGAGKGTVSEILRDRCGMRYQYGTSQHAANLVFDVWGKNYYQDAGKCWEDRRNHREMWHRIIIDHNSDDLTKMYREVLETQDILEGVRDDREQRACYKARIVDLWVWVENNRVPPDPTVKYTAEDCDIVILNNGSMGQLVDRVMVFGEFIVN